MAIVTDEDTLPRARRSLAALVGRFAPLEETGRKVLVLREVTGLPVGDIARIVGVSEAEAARALEAAHATLL
ncbi:MAG: hypothetical protein QOF76_5043 [Solirubrobacteraceae bacterium]|jgi:DNA-directed RNA polymerase specialized sigma24 family protein|nr:hypothetical protein [Solirubrobacteraceae bacterium]